MPEAMVTTTSADPAVVEIRNLRKSFQRRDGATITPVDDISLDVRAGEFVVLLGPSGCGKTTLLRCAAGLEQPDSYEIRIGERTVFSSGQGILTPPERRSVSVVFQSYALWPHLTVFKNVAYPLRRRLLGNAAVAERVAQVLELVGVGHLAEQYPGQLSGGQQQRVALARALVAGNDLVLFDEQQRQRLAGPLLRRTVVDPVPGTAHPAAGGLRRSLRPRRAGRPGRRPGGARRRRRGR
jgi:iron(III) transport system ATP-binding protein